ELAHVLGMHRNTLQHYMRHHSIERNYAQISNTDLDGLCKEFKRKWPESGLRYIVGFMQARGVHMQ
ncbi:hypothetical protein EDD15DRAFT_2142366, partial [Pisolithus albus]